MTMALTLSLPDLGYFWWISSSQQNSTDRSRLWERLKRMSSPPGSSRMVLDVIICPFGTSCGRSIRQSHRCSTLSLFLNLCRRSALFTNASRQSAASVKLPENNDCKDKIPTAADLVLLPDYQQLVARIDGIRPLKFSHKSLENDDLL